MIACYSYWEGVASFGNRFLRRKPARSHEHGWESEYVPEIFLSTDKLNNPFVPSALKTKSGNSKLKKHDMLYQQAWLSKLNERQSIKWAMRHVVKLAECRLNAKFNEKKSAFLRA